MATSLLTLVTAIAKNLSLARAGSLTAASTTALTAASYPWKTNRADASVELFEGVEIYDTQSGATASPNPNGVSAYAPSTGIFTPSVTYSVAPGATDTFLMFHRGVLVGEVKDAINKALRERRYVTRTPLTLVTDGDMEESGVTHWTGVNATPTKISTAGSTFRGKQVLHVVASATDGYVKSDSISADPTNAGDWYAQVKVLNSNDSAYLIAYDVTNSAIIATSDAWTGAAPGTLELEFTLPDTCRQFHFRLQVATNAKVADFDDLMAFPKEVSDIPLPSWVERPGQVRYLLSSEIGEDRGDLREGNEYTGWWDVEEDGSNPNSPCHLILDPSANGPLWLVASKPYAELTADSDTTLMDRQWLELAASSALLEALSARPGEKAIDWGKRWERASKLLRKWDAARMPQPILHAQANRGG